MDFSTGGILDQKDPKEHEVPAPTEQDEMLRDGSSNDEKAEGPWRGVMTGHYVEVFLAAAIVIIPMLVLSIILISLVYTHLMPDQSSTYSMGNATEIPLGAAYYVNYSATRLVFVSSVSSTLATVLISAAMLLFSYPLAYYLARRSDADDSANLPSPYQLALLIKSLDAKWTGLWSTALYIFDKKGKKVPLVPDLRKAIAMMGGLFILAILIILADVWLHVSTNSVEYVREMPDYVDPSFAPGRGLPDQCLDMDGAPDDGIDCTSNIPGGLKNQSEYIRTAGNLSSSNRLYVSEGQTILGPANAPVGFDFEATSFASRTVCRMVTSLCGAGHMDTTDDGNDANLPYNCSATVAGLNMIGNMSDVSDTESNDNTTDWVYPPDFSNLASSTRLLGFQYFNDAAKTQQTGDELHLNQYTPHLYFGLLFQLEASWAAEGQIRSTTDPEYNSQYEKQPESAPWFAKFAAMDLRASEAGGPNGLMSCETELSDLNNTVQILHSSLMNSSAPQAFITAMTSSQLHGFENLHHSIEQIVANINTTELFPQPNVIMGASLRNHSLGVQLASGFAAAYDRTLLSLPTGLLLQRPALSVTRREVTLVTRVPKAPFFAVVLLDLLYAILGIALTVMALLVLGLGQFKQMGVRDVQARLTLEGVLAEGFESSKGGESAKDVEGLFAERRGESVGIRRIGLGKREANTVRPQNFVASIVKLQCSESRGRRDVKREDSRSNFDKSRQSNLIDWTLVNALAALGIAHSTRPASFQSFPPGDRDLLSKYRWPCKTLETGLVVLGGGRMPKRGGRGGKSAPTQDEDSSYVVFGDAKSAKKKERQDNDAKDASREGQNNAAAPPKSDTRALIGERHGRANYP
ncbi:uncharacterized protein KY384_004790 [Bacidia gigantensis]|uniref:uncharacterized protein n=1 Tax=Bacidia gigantensis TaxID=2732470 RepID=UPI001D058AAA|nr:uncharacterized protein KY384_004790 [Bacidia gigantensis]KAG8530288.1 hypothetical protein KY384_004790 [Bacidia gigantensis]